MKSLISLIIKERKDLVAENISEFSEKYVWKFKNKICKLIKKDIRKVRFPRILQLYHQKTPFLDE